MLAKYLTKEGFECDERVDAFDDLRGRIVESYSRRLWYSFIMIDIDLHRSRDPISGIDCYQQLATEFPSESFVIYTSQDIQPIRREINRLLYRNVELVLLDKVLQEEDIRFYLKRLVQDIDHRKVFIVHGRHAKKTKKINKFLSRGLGLEVISWQDARDQVRTQRKTIFDIVLAGIEMSSCTLVLFTDDEESELREELRASDDFEETRGKSGERKRCSRPNVYIEAGYAFGKRPDRTVFVEWPDRSDLFQSASDFGGYYVVRFNDRSGGREDLKRVLENARCELSLASDWLSMKL